MEKNIFKMISFSLFFQTLTCGEYNEVLDKEAAILILKVNNLCLLKLPNHLPSYTFQRKIRLL